METLGSVRKMSYTELALVLLNVTGSPFDHFRPPRDMRRNMWYRFSQLSSMHGDLAEALVDYVGDGGYMVELGSFIGNSATTWVQAMHRQNVRASLVCIDTWLGDANMWLDKGKWLGPQGKAGEPRLFEQFMLNVAGNGVADRVLPLRMSATIGMKYLESLIKRGEIPPPRVIYLDAAHEYPETEIEAAAAWRVLAPGGFLVGDDYDHGLLSNSRSTSSSADNQPTRFIPSTHTRTSPTRGGRLPTSVQTNWWVSTCSMRTRVAGRLMLLRSWLAPALCARCL